MESCRKLYFNRIYTKKNLVWGLDIDIRIIIWQATWIITRYDLVSRGSNKSTGKRSLYRLIPKIIAKHIS